MNSCRFGRFELRSSERRLLANGEPVNLGARAFDLLLALVQRRDRVVGAPELFELIWPGLVVEENNIRQQVAAIRRVLGPGSVATVAGRGYRFAVPIEGDDQGADAQPTSVPARRASIAVLPFRNLSDDPGQEYFADAVTQDIIARLAKHRWLTVMARNTVFGFKHVALDSRSIARQLGVQYVVEGSVRRAGSRMRITAELIDAESGSTCWSEHYDREVAEVFEVQDEITETVVARLEPEIGFLERRRVEHAPSADLQAWDCLHLGMSHFYRFTESDNAEALRLLERSRAMDPRFGDAHAWWAYASVLDMVYWRTEPQQSHLDAALTAVQQALTLDDQNALYYMVKGRVQLARKEYDSARGANEIAIALNPTLAAAYCALGDTLAYQRRYDEALERFRKAIALSPHDPQRWAFLSYGALALLFKGDHAQALSWAEQAREIPNCQYWTSAHRVVALAHLGDEVRAREAARDLQVRQPGFSVEFAARKLFYVKDPEQVNTYLRGLAAAGVPAAA